MSSVVKYLLASQCAPTCILTQVSTLHSCGVAVISMCPKKVTDFIKHACADTARSSELEEQHMHTQKDCAHSNTSVNTVL